MRDAIQVTRLSTLRGVIQFDANGDFFTKTVGIFQIVHDTALPLNDVLHQYKYIGVAPQT